MQAVGSLTSDNRSKNSGSTYSARWPSDLRAFGLILDRSHAEIAFPLANERGQVTFRVWQRQPQFAYCVLGGELHRRTGGFVGGMAADWPAALHLFHRSYEKLDKIAVGRGTSFSSCWFFLLSAEETAEARELMAVHQTVEGSA